MGVIVIKHLSVSAILRYYVIFCYSALNAMNKKIYSFEQLVAVMIFFSFNSISVTVDVFLTGLSVRNVHARKV